MRRALPAAPKGAGHAAVGEAAVPGEEGADAQGDRGGAQAQRREERGAGGAGRGLRGELALELLVVAVGRVGVVVGGNVGLGQLIAVKLAKEGAKLAIVGAKGADALNSAQTKNVEAQIQALDGATPVKLFEGELQNWSFVDKTYDAIAKEFGRIDFVVNCVPAPKDSGVKPTALVDVDAEAWDEAMGVSAKAVFLSCKRAVQQMLTQDNGAVRGRIVNISSLYGMVARKGHFTFGVGKAAIVQLTRQIAAEYAASGIICNAVAPGFIDDSISRDDCLAPASNNRIPAEEPGKAMDVANAVTFLVSDDARYVHGINLLVDGGYMAS
ncbi:unnamed protein product [Phytophthora lilii]|uniref:Unnamed protein product n=1 Tax=Phytophthora lilii TaxID=2077276 RepID=A0A9W6YKI3_9STRA|nr:unnamed protein product [Phytophthora lilii]